MSGTVFCILVITCEDNLGSRLVVVKPCQLLSVSLCVVTCVLVCVFYALCFNVAVVNPANWRLVYSEVPSWLCWSCIQVNTILRCHTACAGILCLIGSIVCVLDSHSIEDRTWLTINFSLSCSLEVVTQILSLELNNPKA